MIFRRDNISTYRPLKTLADNVSYEKMSDLMNLSRNNSQIKD